MIKAILIIIHTILCALLVAVVILQKGKGADIGAVFGSTTQTLFGVAGPGSFLQKITAFLAAAFFLTSLGLSVFMSKAQVRSVMDNVKVTVTEKTNESK